MNTIKIIFTVIFLHSITIIVYSCDNKKVSCQEECHTNLERLKSIGLIIDPDNINSKNNSNNKHGLWITENDTYINITTYNNGKKDGVESIYYKKNKTLELNYTFTYNKGFLTNAIMYNNGKVYSVIENIRNNCSYLTADTIFKFSGFCKDFDDNGRIEAEGMMVFGDELEIDFENVGKWKIYDENGSFIIKDYDKH